ncbi:carboxymuconolactone decarboxylase family protein [Facilibium subflavum]|uniref:carboxymuconolactone decarboxylase family protein n=1 Tax=Facilibium subflavum TaxID=2219058 RepID=UPI000E645D8F|nr:carboxymuconolactone decarboxylase family protein [Facilibium subflavum]
MTTSKNTGMELFQTLHGKHSAKQLMTALSEICPEYVDMTMGFSFGQIFNRPYLSLKDRELIVIALCAALGDMSLQLKAHLEAAINCGATKNECIEAILQTVCYSGFARVSNALFVAKQVFETEVKSHNR